MLNDNNISVANRLIISQNAHLILPYHIAMDKAKESAVKSTVIGTTGRGIGPAYTDKVARVGIKVFDILNEKLVIITPIKSDMTSLKNEIKKIIQ